MLRDGVRIDDDVDIPLVIHKNKSFDLDISYNQVFTLLFMTLVLPSYLHSLPANQRPFARSVIILPENTALKQTTRCTKDRGRSQCPIYTEIGTN